MLKKSYLLTTLLILLLVLVACSSTKDSKDETSVENDNSPASNEEIEKPEDEGLIDSEGENKEDNQNEATENKVDENDNTADDFLSTAKQIDSDAQDFSIYILPNYTLTSEEPGRDSLYLTEDGQFFMRIETLPADDETYEYLNDNIITSLEATSKAGVAPAELTDGNLLPQGEAIEDVVGYTVDTEEGMTSGILFKRDDLLIRLTIFDTTEADYFTDFLQMSETITKK